MFDGLTKSKFYTKCKSSVRMTKTRLDALKKKKNAVAKYLKNDMADLLRSGLDYNAYNRAEGLMVEQNMMACYDFIEQFCACISANLSALNKQRECPEECKAAVQSLIYAAARFSEFPELRDLRNLFTDRYGTSLEPYINKEFVERVRPKTASKEIKLQLMHDISHEFSIEWSSKSLEQKLFQPPAPHQDRHYPLNNTSEDKYISKKNKAEERDIEGVRDDDPGNKPNQVREDIVPKVNEREPASQRTKNSSFDKYKMQNSKGDEVVSPPRRDSTDRDSTQASSSSVGSISEDEVESKKPFYYRFIPPPYIKTKSDKELIKAEEPPKPNETDDHDDLSGEDKPKPRSVRSKPLKPPPGRENSFDNPLKPPPGREKASSEGDRFPGINPSALQKYQAKWGSVMSQAEDDDKKPDEEEKIIDGLLMHYSKKESPYKLNKREPHLEPNARRKSDSAASSDASRRRNAKFGATSPKRTAALLSEQEVPTGGAGKKHVRAFSADREMLQGGGAHPNLPDFDELAARVAALKGK